MINSHNFDNLELLRVAKDTAEQKGLGVEIIIKAIEESIQSASHRKYGNCKLRVTVDRKTGIISIYREVLVTDDDGKILADNNCESNELTNDYSGYKLITLSEALVSYPDAQVGGIFLEQLPPIDLDYSSAKIAKQRIAQIIRTEERKKQYEEYKNSVGELIYGVVKRIEYHNVIVDLNGNEGFLPASNLIKGESFRPGDKIKAHIEDVRQEDSGAQIFLSRVNKGFMEQLFKQEIPEIDDGIVTIKSIARDPGSRSKIAVFSSDRNIDPVGACIGARGARIQSIISELNGEKIDVIAHSPELGKFVVSAIAPAEVLKVVIDEDKEKIELIVPENQIRLAIGRLGQNVKLASELVGWKIDILGDEAESGRKTKELNVGTTLFVEGLNVEEIIGQLLFTEGFSNIEDIHQASVADIANIEGFNEEIAVELKNRAVEYLNNVENKEQKKLQQLFVDEVIKTLPSLQIDDIMKLYKNGIKNLEGIAELSTDEFFETVPEVALSKDEVDSMILESRKKLGWL